MILEAAATEFLALSSHAVAPRCHPTCPVGEITVLPLLDIIILGYYSFNLKFKVILSIVTIFQACS